MRHLSQVHYNPDDVFQWKTRTEQHFIVINFCAPSMTLGREARGGGRQGKCETFHHSNLKHYNTTWEISHGITCRINAMIYGSLPFTEKEKWSTELWMHIYFSYFLSYFMSLISFPTCECVSGCSSWMSAYSRRNLRKEFQILYHLGRWQMNNGVVVAFSSTCFHFFRNRRINCLMLLKE